MAPSRYTCEAEMRANTIGEPKLHLSTIRLVEYDWQWPVLFEREAERIRKVLAERMLRVQHCGSTSVPGLVAKPLIDIVLEVADSSDENSYVPALQAVGYVLQNREPGWFQHRMFKGPDTDVNLHVFSAGSAEVERMLLFCDWLRSNPADRELYARTKLELAHKTWRYVQHYADAKTEVIEEILVRARAACILGNS
jgi:GrpB-like predicted nucleotidyltransferase (UPF0157 family)